MMEELIDKLCTSEAYLFSDWKSNDIPNVCAGVYAIYDLAGSFLYIGMAGAELTKEKIESRFRQRKSQDCVIGLAPMPLGIEVGGRFNIYIGDLFVLKNLTKTDIDNISKGIESFDSHIKEYITLNLSYRYIITSHNQVRELETYIQKNGIKGEKPVINAKSN